MHLHPLLLPFFAAAIGAQATLTVDALGGPGTYPDIQAALAVAVPGDRIDVLAQPNVVYPAFQTGLGVRLFGIGDPALQPFTVALLPSVQVFTAKGLQVLNGTIDLHDCSGSVHLDAVVGYCDNNGCQGPALSVQRCGFVSANRCEFTGQGLAAVEAADSTLVLSESEGLGSDASANRPSSSSPALHLVRCTTSLAGGGWYGGSEDGALPASPALQSTDGQIDLCGDSTTLSGGQLVAFAPAIDATGGVIRLDPAVTLQPSAGGPAIVGTAQVQPTDIPFATLEIDGQGGSLVASGKFVPQTLGALLLGLPLRGQPLPSYGDLWLAPGTIATLAIGNFDSRGKLARVVTIPSVPALRGLVLGAQAFGFGLSPVLPRFGSPAFDIVD